MKYIKMLGLAAVAVAVVALAGAGSASAAGILCSTTVSPCPAAQRVPVNTILDFSLVAGVTDTTELTGGTTLDTCTAATIKAKLNTNETGNEATATNEVFTQGTGSTPCTKAGNIIKLGKFKINNIAGTSNGTVIADEEITWTYAGLFSGENCIYGLPAGTSIGDLTEGNPAILHINAVKTKIADGTDKCVFGPSTIKWTSTYQLTSPSTTTSVSSS